MPQLPADIPFEAWLDYLFGEPVGPSGFRESDDWWDERADPDLAVAYLTRLFEAPEVLLASYPHDQIDRGLWFLASESGHLQPLLASPAPWEARRRGLRAIGDLFERLLAPACTNHLGHLDRGPEPPDPLNSICYMWWDLFPTWGGHGGEETQRAVDDVLLDVMARTLRLESEPCREGGLHGLGHWHAAYPDRTATIIDEWLTAKPRISPELRKYALSARGGCVL